MIKDLNNNAVALFIATDSLVSGTDEEKQAALRDFAAKNTLTIVLFLAAERTNISQGIKHALDSCSALCATSVIFDEPATLSLPQRELVEIFGMLLASRVGIRFAKDGSIIDQPMLKMMLELMTASMTAESELRSQKIKRSLMIKKRKGIQLGGRKFGMESGEDHIIGQILKLHADGLSLQKICELLALSDIKTVQKKRWHPTTVKRIVERAQLKRLPHPW